MGGEWKEPQTPYAAKYPYNHVYESEPKPGEDVSKKNPPENCGHIMEFDDTPGAERIYLQHKKGTFTEVYPDGTEVHKVMKDRYVIIKENDHLHVLGDGMCTIDGDCHILVKGNCVLEIKGDLNQTVKGNYSLKVEGSYDVGINGSHSDSCDSQRSIKASRIDLN